MHKTVIETDAAPKAIGPYSQGIAVEANKLVFFSGQIALDPATGQLCGTDAAAQTRKILENIDGLLKSRGLGPQNVVKTTVYLTNMSDFAAVNALYGDYFAASLPARSCVAVAALPASALVEIEVLAAE